MVLRGNPSCSLRTSHHMALTLPTLTLDSLSLSLAFSQNDDPFPSHIVNVFSFAHLPFSFTYSAIKYIFLSIYTLHFSKSYFSERCFIGGFGAVVVGKDRWLVCGVWRHEGSKIEIFRPFFQAIKSSFKEKFKIILC